MQFKKLLTDDSAVSPVIGVILMVAITVILAAVIGTFVLGLGEQVGETAPQASFSAEFEDTASSEDFLNLTHDGGEKLSESNINITATGNFQISADPSTAYTSSAGYSSGPQSSYKLSEVSSAGDFPPDIGAGTIIYLKGTSGSSNKNLADDTFRVVWESSSGGSSATLHKWSGPDA